MSTLSSEETRSGLLKEFGVTNPRSYEDDVTEEVQEQSEAEEVVETASEETAEEKASEPSPLDLYTEEKLKEVTPVEEQSEMDKLRQQNYELNQRLIESTKKAEQEIATVQEESALEEVDWTSPDIVKVFAEELDMDEEEAKKFAKISGNLAEVVTQGTVGKKVESIEKSLRAEEVQRRQGAAYQQSWDNLQNGLADAKEMGGLEDEIVTQFVEHKSNSAFGRELQKDPSILSSRGAIVKTVLAIARDVGRDAGSAPVTTPNKTVTGSREEVTGALTKANVGEVKENSNKKSPDETLREQIMSAGFGARAKLPGILG